MKLSRFCRWNSRAGGGKSGNVMFRATRLLRPRKVAPMMICSHSGTLMRGLMATFVSTHPYLRHCWRSSTLPKKNEREQSDCYLRLIGDPEGGDDAPSCISCLLYVGRALAADEA